MTHTVQYNHWVYQKYVDWLSKLPEEKWYQELPSSYPSIFKTLQHIWITQEYWWSNIGENQNFDPEPINNILNIEPVFNGIVENSKKLMIYVISLTEEELIKQVKIENKWFTCDYSKYEYIQHIVLHGTYHRGQIVTIGRNIGVVNAPMTDYNFWKIHST